MDSVQHVQGDVATGEADEVAAPERPGEPHQQQGSWNLQQRRCRFQRPLSVVDLGDLGFPALLPEVSSDSSAPGQRKRVLLGPPTDTKCGNRHGTVEPTAGSTPRRQPSAHPTCRFSASCECAILTNLSDPQPGRYPVSRSGTATACLASEGPGFTSAHLPATALVRHAARRPVPRTGGLVLPLRTSLRRPRSARGS